MPQRFRKSVGVVTGLVGATGGVGGFYLAASLGFTKELTGSYGAGLAIAPIVNGVETGWDQALDLVARRFKETIAAHGPTASPSTCRASF